VSIGYVFFNAKNVPQALGMLKSIMHLGTYRHLTLDRSFCMMTLVAAVGYFAVIGGTILLDHVAQSTRDKAPSRFGNAFGSVLGTLATERWVWITPVVLVLALYLSVVFQPGHAETGPVMYALF
jgi:hypothetical protein